MVDTDPRLQVPPVDDPAKFSLVGFFRPSGKADWYAQGVFGVRRAAWPVAVWLASHPDDAAAVARLPRPDVARLSAEQQQAAQTAPLDTVTGNLEDWWDRVVRTGREALSPGDNGYLAAAVVAGLLLLFFGRK